MFWRFGCMLLTWLVIINNRIVSMSTSTAGSADLSCQPPRWITKSILGLYIPASHDREMGRRRTIYFVAGQRIHRIKWQAVTKIPILCRVRTTSDIVSRIVLYLHNIPMYINISYKFITHVLTSVTKSYFCIHKTLHSM